MKRFRLLIVVVALTLAVPLAFVVWRTYSGLEQEEAARLAYFARTILDAMEAELAGLVVREENRAVDEYSYTLSAPDREGGAQVRSPLSRPPLEPFVLGYFQNNPDGSFQTPLAPDPRRPSAAVDAAVRQLEDTNRIFNRKKTSGVIRRRPPPAPTAKAAAGAAKKEAGFADRYVAPERTPEARTYLGRKSRRVEEITASQVQNLARQDSRPAEAPRSAPPLDATMAADAAEAGEPPATSLPSAAARKPEAAGVMSDAAPFQGLPDAVGRFQVEVAPLQSVFIRAGQIFVFRRIVIDDRIYRQGFVIRTGALLKHLAAAHFQSQPMAAFAALDLRAADEDGTGENLQAGAPVTQAGFRLARTFPAPFDFLTAAIASDSVPASASRRVLNIMLALLAVVFLVGFGAIFHSANTLVDLAERRARFVSSVTHELKTPLTNIRMYIEMLEQGIARDTDREQAYFEILNTESGRLSRLINNVLEMSRLEKGQRHLEMTTGRFQDVLEAVRSVMAAKLAREGFELTIAADDVPPFAYDREAMIQVLINLIENSVKFGRGGDVRQIAVRAASAGEYVEVAVTDTGPGIPRGALKKIFDDFYRVEDALTRTTGGTGIGLALVRKFVTAMGGTVRAANNDGPGCTITLRLPRA